MQLTFLGTGTSQGVPVIGCACDVCTSLDIRDKRLRTSVMITTDNGEKILIDCGPDFRQQMLRQGEKRVDAVFLTHEHNDHVIGMDDLRPVIFREGKATQVYAYPRVLDEVKKRFPYAFADKKYPGAPSFDLIPIHGAFSLFGENIIPIEVLHFQLPVLGFRMRNLAYVTDASDVSDEEKEKLKGLDVLIINCLRKEKSHISHFILPQVLALYQELRPKKMFLTHISHEFGLHSVENEKLPSGVEMAYDGLMIDF